MNETTATPRHNRLKASELRGYVERLERLKAEKKTISDDEKVVMAEAKAAGYTPAAIRYVIKEREKTPAEREETDALRDLYMDAMGMGAGPLFRALSHFGDDALSRDALVERMKPVVPEGGEIIVKVGGKPVRIFREKGGEAQVEDHVERPAPAAGNAGAAAPPRNVWRHDVPDCTVGEAEEFGGDAYRQNMRVIDNPFPPDDKRRMRWDLGWRRASGSDGMGEDDE